MLHLVHVTTHTGDDVTLTLLAEEAHRQSCNLSVELVTHITYYTRTNWKNADGCEIIDTCLQSGGHSQKQSDKQQCRSLAPFCNQTIDIVVHIVHQHRLDV